MCIRDRLWPGAVLDVDALRSIGGFEAPYELAFDTRIFSQMSFLGPVISSTDRQFGFRIHQGSMSSSNWDAQRESLRFIEACHRERLAGRQVPTYEQFVRDEKAKPQFERVARRQSDRAQLLFRSGGQQWLAGEKLEGGKKLLRSAVTWPPAFLRKVLDQGR